MLLVAQGALDGFSKRRQACIRASTHQDQQEACHEHEEQQDYDEGEAGQFHLPSLAASISSTEIPGASRVGPALPWPRNVEEAAMGRFRMGSLYRYVQAPDAAIPVIDGLPSFHNVVAMPPLPSLQLERGISAPAPTAAIDGSRLGAVLPSSNANKAGSAETPWHDIIEPDSAVPPSKDFAGMSPDTT